MVIHSSYLFYTPGFLDPLAFPLGPVGLCAVFGFDFFFAMLFTPVLVCSDSKDLCLNACHKNKGGINRPMK